MKSSVPDPSLVREYLLGRLDDKEELESDLSESILLDDELSDMVDVIEDEIIEEYLDGTLNTADRTAADEYFLRPRERKEKLRFAELLRRHLETAEPEVAGEEVHERPVVSWRSRSLIYGQFAALVVLAFLCLVYVSGARKRQALLEHELVLEQQRSAQQVQEAPLLQSAIVPLTLVSPDTTRGSTTDIPHVDLKPSTERLIVDIALKGGTSRSYDVRLEAKGVKELIWSATLPPIVSPAGDARLLFDVPARGIESGDYSFVVASTLPETIRPKHYHFQIKVTR